MAPKINIKEQLLGIYTASIALLPKLNLAIPVVPKELDSNANQAKIAEAMQDLFAQVKNGLDLAPLFQSQWEDCENFLLAGVDLDLDALRDIFEKAKNLINEQCAPKLESAQNAGVEEQKINRKRIFTRPTLNISMSNTAGTSSKNSDLVIETSFLDDIDFRVSVDQLMESKKLYLQYIILEKKYSEMVDMVNGSSSSSSSSSSQSTLEQVAHEPDPTFALIGKLHDVVFNKIDLNKMKDFLDVEAHLKLHIIKQNLEGHAKNSTLSIKLYAEFMQTLCASFCWEIPELSSVQLNGLQDSNANTNAQLTNRWNEQANNSTSGFITNPILSPYQTLYQKYIDIERNYQALMSAQSPNEQPSKFSPLDLNSLVDIKVILAALRKSIKQLDLHFIKEFTEKNVFESLQGSLDYILSLPDKMDSPELYRILSAFETQLSPLLKTSSENILLIGEMNKSKVGNPLGNKPPSPK